MKSSAVMTYCRDGDALVGVRIFFLLSAFFVGTHALGDYSSHRGLVSAEDYVDREPIISRGPDFDDDEAIGGCPSGWQVYGDDCYLYVKQSAKQWSQAEKYCADSVEGGHLVSLKSEEEMEFVWHLILASGTHWFHKEHQSYHAFSASNDFVWIGLAFVCPEPAAGRWSDGTRVNGSIKVEDAPKPTPSVYGTYGGVGYGAGTTGATRGQQRCVSFHLTMNGGKLMKGYCSDYAPFVCKAAMHPNKTRDDDDADYKNLDVGEDDTATCGSYDWCYNNGSCYKLLAKEQSWYESRGACQSSGGDLVAIHSVTEIDYLNNHLTAEWTAGNSFWTGLNKLESIDDRFQWSDNSPIDFLPAIGVETRAARNPSCVSLKVSQLRRLLAKSQAAGKMRAAFDGELQLSRCDTIRPAVCKRPPKNAVVPAPPTVAAPTSGGCSKGWILYRNRCYRSFGVENETASERSNFRDAQHTCLKYKANLVSIRDQFDNLFVLSLLDGDETNQTWIGLIYNEGKLKWIDETEVGYTNFDSIGMATFGILRTTPAPMPSLTTPSYYNSRTSGFGDPYGSYGSYGSAYLWRQQERCFVMSVDKAPGTWDPISSTGSLSSLITRSVYQSPISGAGRGKRSTYWPYDWRRSLTFSGESCEQQKLSFVCEKSKSANETSGQREWMCGNETNDKGDAAYFKHGSNCYEIITDTQLSWSKAKQRCEQSPNATLTSILTQQEFAFFVSLMKRDDLTEFWIGMQVLSEDNETAVHATWVDGWPVWITKWNQYPTKDKERQCVSMSQVGSAEANVMPYWRQAPCEKKLPFICKHRRDKDEPPNEIKPGGCEPGWIKGSTQCYKIKNDDWTSGANAMLRCWREHNATLASFPTESDWTMISNHQELKEAKRRFFIGLMQKIHGKFEWIDGSPLDFINWAPQEPRFGWNPSVEVCVEMDQKGLWYDAGCHETRHFICSKSKIEDSSAVSPSSSTTTKSSSPSSPSVSPSPNPTVPSFSPTASSSSSSSSIRPDNSTQSGNQSENENVVSKLRSTQKSKSATSQTGVVAGIVVCVVFVLTVVALGVAYVYRRHTQGFPLFRRRSSDAMRFEILNERNDEY